MRKRSEKRKEREEEKSAPKGEAYTAALQAANDDVKLNLVSRTK